MGRLVEIVDKIYKDPKIVRDLTPDLIELESLVRQDEESRLAQIMVQIIDGDELETDQDMREFQQIVNEYQASKHEQPMFPEIEYDFQPPMDLMDELGQLEAQFPGLSTTGDGGAYSDSYVGEAIPVIPMPDEDDLESYIIAQEGDPSPTPYYEEDKAMRPALRSEIPLKLVSVYLPNVGRIDYEVLTVITTRYSANLVFDLDRSKPPFYPEVGLRFELEHASKVFPVMYAGVCFDYEGKRFMSFNIIGE